MDRLSLGMFVAGSSDFETRQYQVLHCLKGCYTEFGHNRLYPAFGELLEVTTSLKQIVEKKDSLEQSFPQHLIGFDFREKKLEYDYPVEGDPEIQRAIDFIAWALPHLDKAINEAVAICRFVDQHIVIKAVGLMPMYKQEGYWLVPDMKAGRLYLLRYKVSLFSTSTARYRQLKTTMLETIEQPMVAKPPDELKLELIKRYGDMPNPAMYACETDLDFPYEATILPIAKRKLMATLHV